MHRFFCPHQNITKDKIIINDNFHIHHIKDVMRFKAGSNIVIFDDKNNEYRAALEQISDDKIILGIKSKVKNLSMKKIHLTIACAIPKKSKIDDIIDKLTQLGVDKIVPLETERVIVRLDKKKKVLKHKRWEKIALNASQQSQRKSIPQVEQVKSFKELLKESCDYDLKLIPTLSEKQKSLKRIFTQCGPKNILVLIGPEGDFTSQEVSLAIKAGFIPITLGESVLRVETAAIAVASFIRLYDGGD